MRAKERVWNQDELDYLRDNYLTTTYKELAQRFNVSREVMRWQLRKMGLAKVTKLEINHHFFNSWRKDSAWLLGLWCADGSVSKGTQWATIISFYQNGIENIERIKKLLGSKHKIQTENGYKHRGCALAFSSLAMYEDMKSLMGCEIEAKSNILQWPKSLPDDIARDFIRGLVDGDGSIRFRKGAPLITFCTGSQSFAQSFRDEVERLTGIHANLSLHTNGTTYYWRVCGLKAKCFAKWLYSDCGDLCLDRKRELANEVMNWEQQVSISKGINRKMKAVFSL